MFELTLTIASLEIRSKVINNAGLVMIYFEMHARDWLIPTQAMSRNIPTSTGNVRKAFGINIIFGSSTPTTEQGIAGTYKFQEISLNMSRKAFTIRL